MTNGVHAPTWAAREWITLANRLAGPDHVEEARGWELLQTVDPAELWSTRNVLRGQLVDEVRRRLRNSWLERGATEAELGWVAPSSTPTYSRSASRDACPPTSG